MSSMSPEKILDFLERSGSVVVEVDAMASARLYVRFERRSCWKKRFPLLKNAVAVTATKYQVCVSGEKLAAFTQKLLTVS